jgi:hypothetical protein
VCENSHTVTRILGGSQNRQKCPKKRHLVLYKLAGFYPDGLTRRSVFKRVGGRGNPQKWPIFGPFLGVNCAKPELIPGGAPRLLTRSPTHNGGRLARWSNRDQSAQRLFLLFIILFHAVFYSFCLIPRCATPNTVPRCAFLGNSMGLPP